MDTEIVRLLRSNIYPNGNKINEIMETLNLLENLEKVTLDWKDSTSVQRLLDVISSILADEYIAVAKQNPEVFLKQGVRK